MKNTPIFQTEMGRIALAIYEWCVENDLWGDNTIYFDDHAITNSRYWYGSPDEILSEDEGARLYYYEDRNPRDYFEYVNPKTLSMSFEGDLYHVLNAYTPGWTKLEDQFRNLLQSFGYYYEMGHAWNLTLYKI